MARSAVVAGALLGVLALVGCSDAGPAPATAPSTAPAQDAPDAAVGDVSSDDVAAPDGGPSPLVDGVPVGLVPSDVPDPDVQSAGDPARPVVGVVYELPLEVPVAAQQVLATLADAGWALDRSTDGQRSAQHVLSWQDGSVLTVTFREVDAGTEVGAVVRPG